MTTRTAALPPTPSLGQPRGRGRAGFVFGFPWYLVVLAITLFWTIYLVLVGIEPVVLSRPGDAQFAEIDDFEELGDAEALRLGVIEGSAQVDDALDIVGEGRVSMYADIEAARAALQAEEIDGVMLDPFFGMNYARGSGGSVELHSDNYFADTFAYMNEGLSVTLGVVVIAYISAVLIGLIVGIIRSAPPKPGHGVRGGFFAIVRLILYQAATLYVSVLRGLPILVTLLVTAFAIVPALRELLIGIGVEVPRRLFLPAGIIALAIAYGAFLSETFRAGIQSIERGQIEAARSLGMSYFQVVRLVVLPQAIRRVLPPLGNDLIAMIKDTSLVSVLGVNDITQLATLWYSTTFRYPETLFLLAMMYLTMTIIGSLVVRYIEVRFTIPGR